MLVDKTSTEAVQMNLKTGDQAMLGDEVVTIHVTTKEVSCLIEHSDGSFSRVGASALLPLDEPKMRSVTAEVFKV
jgi:hypothetical protein